MSEELVDTPFSGWELFVLSSLLGIVRTPRVRKADGKLPFRDQPGLAVSVVNLSGPIQKNLAVNNPVFGSRSRPFSCGVPTGSNPAQT